MKDHGDREGRFARAESALEEFFARAEAGEAVDFEVWAAERREISAELRELHALCRFFREPLEPAQRSSTAGVLALDALKRASNRFRDYAIESAPLAEGGMGTILAARDVTLGRGVALKVLRASGDDHRVARFLEEARITSRLDHPGIVPIHEVGLDAAGRPYIAMKQVHGLTLETILERCAKGDADWPRARVLGVLERVCEAVAFAHKSGVIHRDLKPSNVMVGDFGEVYVMDWGLARASDASDERDAARSADISDAPEVTQDGEVIGTPTYMAPEQALGRRAEVGPATDVYSVGAMLYELLARRPPYADGDRPLASRVVLERVLKGPPAPLQRDARDAPPELIAICEKAMRRDWHERYADVAELSRDLSDFLRGRVVRAHEGGAWAEARKWVQRNRALAASLGAACFFLVAGVVASRMQAQEARAQAQLARDNAAEAVRASERAEQNAASAREHEREARRSEAEARASELRAKRVTEFVQTALIGSDPNRGGDSRYLVTDAMDSALAEIDAGALEDDPETEAVMLSTIARILLGNARPADALRLAERALDTRRSLFGDDDMEVGTSRNDVACCLEALGRSAEALPSFESALAISRRTYDGDHRDTATCMNNVARCLDVIGRSTEALAMHEEALAMRQRLFAGDHADVAQSANNVGLCLARLGRLSEALDRMRASLEMYRRLQRGDHPILVTGTINVATCLDVMGRHEEALPMFEQALAMSRRIYPGDHPATAAALSARASCLRTLGRRDEALALQLEALEMRRRLYPGDHPEVAVSLNNTGQSLVALQRADEALPLFEAALRMNHALHAGDHPDVASSACGLAACLEALGRRDEALANFEEALAMRRRMFPPGHADVAGVLDDVARVLCELGRGEESLREYREAIALYERAHENGHANFAACLLAFADCLAQLGRTSEALAEVERASAMIARLYPEGHPACTACARKLEELRATLARETED